MSNAAIAAVMFVSVRTIESHLRNIRRKTETTERQEIGGLHVEGQTVRRTL